MAVADGELARSHQAIRILLGVAGGAGAFIGLDNAYKDGLALLPVAWVVAGLALSGLAVYWPPKNPIVRIILTHILKPIARRRVLIATILIVAGVVLLAAEISSQRAELDAYVAPRTLSEQQLSDLRTYLQKHGSGRIDIKYLQGSAEAQQYAGQFAGALANTPWELGAFGSETPDIAGVGITIREERVGQPLPGKQPKRPSEILQDALRAANMPPNGGASAWNRPENKLELVIGARPVNITSQTTLRARFGQWVLRNWIYGR